MQLCKYYIELNLFEMAMNRINAICLNISLTRGRIIFKLTYNNQISETLLGTTLCDWEIKRNNMIIMFQFGLPITLML